MPACSKHGYGQLESLLAKFKSGEQPAKTGTPSVVEWSRELTADEEGSCPSGSIPFLAAPLCRGSASRLHLQRHQVLLYRRWVWSRKRPITLALRGLAQTPRRLPRLS